MNSDENRPLHRESWEESPQTTEDSGQNWDDTPDIPEIEAQIVKETSEKESFQAETPDWWEAYQNSPAETPSTSAEMIDSPEELPQEAPSTSAEIIPESQESQEDLNREVEALKAQKQQLEAEIQALSAQKAQLMASQTAEIEQKLQELIETSLEGLEQRKQALEISVEQLERRRERIREEMRTTFAGVSQELAIRVQGFKEYLVGSLQDLVAAAEQLELTPSEDDWDRSPVPTAYNTPTEPTSPQFAKQKFKDQIRQIQEILDQYRTRPDYYGPPWQLRRTFEPIHADRVKNWFFSQGGRGAIRSMGSRLQNILITSAIISVLHNLYGDRCRILILANAPEQLGEWRRGLQDCLGISRSDFAPERGIGLFESAEALIQKADRLLEDKKLPLVIIDEAETEINLSLLQFPLWLAFAPEPQPTSGYLY